jgi:hypothetical protein
LKNVRALAGLPNRVVVSKIAVVTKNLRSIVNKDAPRQLRFVIDKARGAYSQGRIAAYAHCSYFSSGVVHKVGRVERYVAGDGYHRRPQHMIARKKA